MALSEPKTIESASAETTPALRDSPQRWWLLALLFTAMLISYVHRSALSVAAPFISKDLNLSKAEMGVLLSSFFWVYAFMQVPAGWIVDRFGVRRAYSLGFIFWSLASTFTGFGVGMASLLGLRIATGAGQAITFPASSRACANWFPDRERGKVTGVYLTGVRLGAALVSWLGAYFLSRYSWKLFFLIIGLIPLIWLLPWNRFLGRWETHTTDAHNLTNRTSFFQSLMLLRYRSVFGIFLGFFAYDYGWYVFLTWLPSYLKDERKFTTSEMGIYSATPLVACSQNFHYRRPGDRMFDRTGWDGGGQDNRRVAADDLALWLGPGFAKHLDLNGGGLPEKDSRHSRRHSKLWRQSRRHYRAGADRVHCAQNKLFRARVRTDRRGAGRRHFGLLAVDWR